MTPLDLHLYNESWKMNENDIVRRSRDFLCDEHGEWDVAGEALLREAADEIERLRECLKEARAAAKAFLRELGRDE